MNEFYVEIGVWVVADTEDDAKARVAEALSITEATEKYDILAVSPSDA